MKFAITIGTQQIALAGFLNGRGTSASDAANTFRAGTSHCGNDISMLLGKMQFGTIYFATLSFFAGMQMGFCSPGRS